MGVASKMLARTANPAKFLPQQFERLLLICFFHQGIELQTNCRCLLRLGSYIANSRLTNVETGLTLLNSSLTIVDSILNLRQGISCAGSIPTILEITNTSISSSIGPTLQLDVNSNNVALVVNRSQISQRYGTAVDVKIYSFATVTFENSVISSQPYDYAINLTPSAPDTKFTLNILSSSFQGTVLIVYQFAVSMTNSLLSEFISFGKRYVLVNISNAFRSMLCRPYSCSEYLYASSASTFC